MSNPGVIKLSENTIDGKRFVIEDNIGEAIHIHYDNIRLDLSIKEFKELGRIAEKSLLQLLEIPGFTTEKMDPELLTRLAGILPDLEKIEKTEISSAQLSVILEENRYMPMDLPKVCDRYQYQTDCKDFEVSLFNDENYIMGGFDAAMFLYQQNPEQKIPVTRYYFKKKKHSYNYQKVSEQIERYRHCQEIIQNELEQLPPEAKIAFRGGGIHMERIMALMPQNRNVVCVIEKNAAKNYDLQQNNTIPLSQIDEVEFDTVIISSFGYRTEMYQELQNVFHGKIIDFYDLFQKNGYQFKKPYYMIEVLENWVTLTE